MGPETNELRGEDWAQRQAAPVRVLRVLEYSGPRWWVELQMQNASVGANGPRFDLQNGQRIRELMRSEVPA